MQSLGCQIFSCESKLEDDILKMEIPITQSEAWAELQKKLGEKAIFQKEANFQFLAIVKKTPVGNYLYCPYGPVAEDTASFCQALNSLTQKIPGFWTFLVPMKFLIPDYQIDYCVTIKQQNEKA